MGNSPMSPAGTGRRWRPGPDTAIALAALVLAGAGVGWAATSASSGVVNACAEDGTGALSLAPPGGCGTGATPLQWNIQGPVGPQGLTGVQGPAGIQGPPGSSVSGIDDAVVHVGKPSSSFVNANAPLLQPPSYRHRFSIQATLGSAGRYLATASVDLHLPGGRLKRTFTYDCRVLVTVGGSNAEVFDDPLAESAGGVYPVDYGGTITTSGPGTLTFECSSTGMVQYGLSFWENPTVYAGLLETPKGP